jgi:serine/threonine protein kinase
VAKIGDFGLAAHVAPNCSTFLRTWRWLAPEVIEGRAYSHRCDLYSYGLLVCEMYTGEIPFSEYSEYVTIRENVVQHYCPHCAAEWFSKWNQRDDFMVDNCPMAPSCHCQSESRVLQSCVIPKQGECSSSLQL